MTPADEAAALLARYDSAIAYGNGPLVVDLAVRNMPDLLRALLDEQTRLQEEVTHLRDQRNTAPSPDYLLMCLTVDRDALKSRLEAAEEEITRLREALAKERQTEKTKT